MGKRKKIVLIGPVYPYKGGIAHYTSLLYQELVKKHDVELVSYKMQYPKFLFKKEQKDYSNDMFKVADAEFLINTANPFNILRVGCKIKKKKPDLVIVQWWHPYFAPCYRVLESALGKKIHIMFICHNVFPHERFPMDRLLTKMVLKRGTSFIVHSKSDGEDLLTINPDARYRQNPHPTYNAFKIRGISKEQARRALEIPKDDKMILFFGFVREYKGLKYLLRAVPEIKKQIDKIRLFVVGSFGDDKDAYLQIIEEENIEDNISIVDNYIPDNDVEKYFAACDLVVCPYISATQSGIVQIAYGFDKPVVVTNVGGLPDVVENGKTGYIVETENSMELAKVIVDFYENKHSEEMIRYIRESTDKFSWERMEKTIIDVINSVAKVKGR